MIQQLPLVNLAPPQPPPGAPVVECVLVRGRVRVRVVSGKDASGADVTPGTWCTFPKKKRHAGARFAVQQLRRVQRRRSHYYVTSQPHWLLIPGGTP